MMQNCQRIEPPLAGTEHETLFAFLDWQRDTLLCKIHGLSDEQLRMPHHPSGLTLLGLVKHLSDVERSWFREVFAGEDLAALWDDNDPQRYWRVEPHETTAEILDGYRAEVATANTRVSASALVTPVASPRPGEEEMTLRWVVVHMIEETARHVGHADFMREAIDGQTGE